MQSKLESIIEVFHNQWIGITIGWMIVYFIFPLFQHLEQIYVATISSVLFFISSAVRTYVIRRWNNKKIKEKI